MNRSLAGVALVIYFLLAGCGHNSSDSVPPQGAVISRLSYTPDGVSQITSAYPFVAVHGAFDFSDPNGDVSTMTCYLLKSTDQFVNYMPAYPVEVKGQTSGKIDIDWMVDASVKETYQVVVFVTDSQGVQSNRLVDTFEVK